MRPPAPSSTASSTTSLAGPRVRPAQTTAVGDRNRSVDLERHRRGVELELCRVCLRAPVTAGGVCDDCRQPWQTDAPTWILELGARTGNGVQVSDQARCEPRGGALSFSCTDYEPFLYHPLYHPGRSRRRIGLSRNDFHQTRRSRPCFVDERRWIHPNTQARARLCPAKWPPKWPKMNG
jgi:hypothetical protein